MKINEFSILLHLLSRKINKFQMGASKEEIIEKLHINGKNEHVYFHRLLTNLSKQIEPLGLYIRYNSLDRHWFISHSSKVSELLSANPFEDKPKLAATLFCVLVCCHSNSGLTTINEIKDLRKKKGILKDLKALEDYGYVKLDTEKKEVKITPLVGYQLDLSKLFMKLSLQLKSAGNNAQKIKTEENEN
jgi:hypothetical protein